MKYIFVDPTELRASSRFPLEVLQEHYEILECPGLEQLTGMDFYLTHLPLCASNAAALKVLIQDKSIFVQRKSGGDIFSHQQLYEAASRVQKCQIPMPQAILLFIGKVLNVGNDKDVVINAKFYPYDIQTLGVILGMMRSRGFSVDHIETEDVLLDWIQVQFKVIQKCKDEPLKLVTNPTAKEQYEPGNVLQVMNKIEEDDPRSIIVNGIAGIGIKSITEYFEKMKQCGFSQDLLTFLKLVTSLDEKGKPRVELGTFGLKTRDRLRKAMSLGDGMNIGIEFLKNHDENNAFRLGVKMAVGEIQDKLERGIPLELALETTFEEVTNFLKEDEE